MPVQAWLSGTWQAVQGESDASHEQELEPVELWLRCLTLQESEGGGMMALEY